ncbi:MAG: hypothetical protein WAL29_15345, partial [Bacteroidales bacterium]
MEINKYPEWVKYLKKRASAFFHVYSVPRWLVFIHDNILVFLTFIFAYLLRYNLIPSEFPLQLSIVHGLVALTVYAGTAIIFKSYAGLLRHTTLTDISLVFLTTSVSAFLLILLSLAVDLSNLTTFLRIPISVILIHYVLVSVILFSMRISIKMLFLFATSSVKTCTKRVLIYGAG